MLIFGVQDSTGRIDGLGVPSWRHVKEFNSTLPSLINRPHLGDQIDASYNKKVQVCAQAVFED